MKYSIRFKSVLAGLVFLLFIPACRGEKQAKGIKNQEPSKERVSPITQEKKMDIKFSEPQESQVDAAKSYQAILKTEKGDIKLELFAKQAPLGVTNFIQLAKGGFYNGLTFHRVEPGFVIQGGDPQGNGTGGPGYTIPAEIGPLHGEGALAWARTGDQVNPERRSSGSQFYITLEPTPFLDGAYSVFGQTLEGMEVVQSIRRGDKILSIEIIERN